MDTQMIAQKIAEELESSQLFRSVQYWKRLNTVTVEYDEKAENAQEIEAVLAELGFNEPGYGSARLDKYREPREMTAEERAAYERAQMNFRNLVATEYLRK